MKLAGREIDKVTLVSAGYLAQRRLAEGIRLNVPESIALLATQVMYLARRGCSVSFLMNEGKKMLGKRQVLPGVAAIVDEVQVEATFPDGTKLVTIHHPICTVDGNLQLALQGSFLPVPDLNAPGVFPACDNEGLIPGQVLTLRQPIKLNVGREYVEIEVMNTADRPIQVGSHYHFIETNRYLRFDRRAAYGMRLNIAAGTSIRFEPGESKRVALVSIVGNQVIRGGNNLCNGAVDKIDPVVLDTIIDKAVAEGFEMTIDGPNSSIFTSGGGFSRKRKLSDLSSSNLQGLMSNSSTGYAGLDMPRDLYARMFGPTTGDVVRLADTELYIRVERDLTVYGDECKFGGGKVLREGMGQATGLSATGMIVLHLLQVCKH